VAAVSLLFLRERRRELCGVSDGGHAADRELGVELRLGSLDGLGVDLVGVERRRRSRRSG
jgi:hypothetical protein